MTDTPRPTPPRDQAELLDRLADARVLVVGDLMLDLFVEGRVARISPESPAPVFEAQGERAAAGGAANVAVNVAALGARCTLLGVVGADEAGARLAALLAETPGVAAPLVQAEVRPTSRKTRFVTGGHHMLRVDVEERGPIPAEVEAQLLAAVDAALPEVGVVVLSDYAKGVLTPAVREGVIARARAAGAPVVVDPKSVRFADYRGATVIKPNAREAEAATGVPLVDDAAAERAGQAAVVEAGVDAVLITRGPRGMTLVQADGAAVHLPSEVREVFDVVGAGDTVCAALAVAMALGADLPLAAAFANRAGGLVVGKRGTATVSAAELRAVGRPSTGVVLPDREAAARWAASERAAGRRVGFTNGCFDLLHPGHVAVLSFARAHCDRLLVGLNSDSSVRRLKGPARPVNGEADRAALLAALGMVDAVCVFAEDTPAELIGTVAPDVLVKGGDYAVETVVGHEQVLARGGQVLICPTVPGQSSTAVIARMGAA